MGCLVQGLEVKGHPRYPWEIGLLTPFTDKETDTRRGHVTCQEVTQPGNGKIGFQTVLIRINFYQCDD